MMFTAAFERFLGRYGQTVEICYQGQVPGVTASAFVQPIREKKMRDMPTPLGWVKDERFLYLGDPGAPLDGLESGFISWQGRRFDVQCAQAVYVGSELSHWWAVLTPRDGEETP